MDNTDIIQRVVDDLKGVLQSIAQLHDKNLQVLSVDELLDKSKNVALPAVGVIYEGMRAVGEPGKDTNRHGQSAEAVFMVVVAGHPSTNKEPSIKASTLALLGQIRNALKTRKSPTNHIYRFLVEVPEKEVGNTILWSQRWSLPIPMI